MNDYLRATSIVGQRERKLKKRKENKHAFRDIQHAYANHRKYFGIPRRLIKKTAIEALGAVRAKLAGDKAMYFRKCWELNCLMGYITEAKLIHKEAEGDTAIHGRLGDPEILPDPMDNE
jgi:hypothetical protein